MSRWRILSAILALSLAPLRIDSQSGSSTSPPARQAEKTKPRLSESTLKWLYAKWRKYGQWDYKQRGFKYRDFTSFNFGVTGRSVGLSKDEILALARLSQPTQDDVRSLDDPELVTSFHRNADALDTLRAMAQQDARVIRIAKDFTGLESTTEWPRKDIGFSEERWNEYRSLFEKLSLAEGIVRSEDFPGAIFFIVRVKGLCVSGSSSGYVYSTKELTPVVDSPGDALDAEMKGDANKGYAYVFKPLKANWYAFYEVDW